MNSVDEMKKLEQRMAQLKAQERLEVKQAEHSNIYAYVMAGTVPLAYLHNDIAMSIGTITLVAFCWSKRVLTDAQAWQADKKFFGLLFISIVFCVLFSVQLMGGWQ